ncbi:unnamed protein product [Pipistrellus nathusii]|uniref:Kazal-like domain-containing protein n=1 Tax=Pipistrellus nathusii TaxID=59473 RepID=A0ABP0A6R8_PIPNA
MRVTAFVLLLALALIEVECAGQSQEIDCSPFKKLPPEERLCYTIYRPVCGSDDKTYINDCFFCFEMEEMDNKLKFVHFVEC